MVTAFVREKLLYEDALHHNCVFVGMDEHGVAKHAHLRSTSSSGKVFRINVEGARQSTVSTRMEQTVPSMSLKHPSTCCPTSRSIRQAGWSTAMWPAVVRLFSRCWSCLRQNPKLNMVYLCLDNDEAGEDACESMMEVLDDLDVDVERLRPQGKDWNDDLRAKRGGHG